MMGFAFALPILQSCRHAFAASRRNSPELCLISPPSYPRGRREGRVPAGTHGPLCACSARRNAQRHTGEAEHTAFPAQWVDGLCRALPGAEFLLASLTPRIIDAVHPVGLACTSAKSLTVATTARTTRFCRTRVRRPPQSSPALSTSREKCWRDELSAPLIRTWPRTHRDYPPCPHLSCRRCRVHRTPARET